MASHDDKPDEHSGLHEIKELAKTTKRRISRRVTTEHDIEESLLASGSALNSLALPEPGKERPAVSAPAAAVSASAPAAASEDAFEPEAVTGRRGSAGLVLSAVAVAAIGAAAAFLLLGGDDGASGEPAPAAASPVAESGSEPAAPPAAPAPAPVPAVAALEETAADDAEEAPGEAALAAEEPAAEAATPAAEAAPTARRASAGAPSRERARGSERARPEPAKAKAEPAQAEPAQAEPAIAAAPADEAPEPTADDGASLDDVLAGVTGGVDEADEAAAVEEKKAPAKTRLDRSDVAKAMGAVSGKAKSCYEVEEHSGTVSIRFTVAPDGSVTRAKATGAHASSATGRCVAGAVEGASFPAYDGRPTSFTFPFLLAP